MNYLGDCIAVNGANTLFDHVDEICRGFNRHLEWLFSQNTPHHQQLLFFPKVRIEKKNIQNVVSLKTATVITRLWVTINASWITRIFEGKNETYRYELRAFSELVSDRTKEENPVITRSVRPGLSFER